MRLVNRMVALGLIVGLLGPLSSAQAADPGGRANAPRFEATDCPPDAFLPPGVDCGFVMVPENRAIRGGRTIKIVVAVVRATTAHPAKDAIVFVNGGPSVGTVQSFATDFYFAGAPYAEDHDVVLVDSRGIGHSEPYLGCPELDEASVTAFYSQPFAGAHAYDIATDALRACHDRLEASGVDLASYTSAEGAADLDAVRRALGYRDWNLIALSADGVLGLTYMRLYPQHIRSAVIDSGQSTQHLWGLDYDRGNSELLARVFAGCAANPACDAAYPDIDRAFDDTIRDLNRHPRLITLPDFLPNPATLRIDGAALYRDTLGAIFPGNAFAPEAIHQMLSDLWRQTHGELDAVYREWLGTGPIENDHANDFVAVGKTMSYICHDVAGFITKADLRRAAHDLPALAPLYRDPQFDLADTWMNAVSPAGCAVWDVGVADKVQHQPVKSTIPTLVLAGEYDNAVPPLIVRQIPPTLPNSYYYEFPAAPHVQLAWYNPVSDCARSITDQFLRTPGRTPDSSCIGDLPAFDFTPSTELRLSSLGVPPSAGGSRAGRWSPVRTGQDGLP